MIEDEIFSWFWISQSLNHNHCFPVYCETEIINFNLKEENAMNWFNLSELNHLNKVVPGFKNNTQRFFQSKVT